MENTNVTLQESRVSGRWNIPFLVAELEFWGQLNELFINGKGAKCTYLISKRQMHNYSGIGVVKAMFTYKADQWWFSDSFSWFATKMVVGKKN